MYVLTHFAVHQKLTQHCKSTIFQSKINKKMNNLENNVWKNICTQN